eukprot:gene19883-21824_t
MEQYLVKDVPQLAYYFPDFISQEEESLLLGKIYNAPKPKWTQLSNRRLQNWGGLPHPKTNEDIRVTQKDRQPFVKIPWILKGMVSEKLPQWLSKYTDEIASLGVFEEKFPNHVLINEYLPGQGIMPHLDGPLFFPAITTLSLGSHTVLDFYQPLNDEKETRDSKSSASTCDETNTSSFESRYIMSILLQPRSLVVFKEDMYNHYLHGIQEKVTDTITQQTVIPDKNCKVAIGDTLERKTRISLTIRHFPKILKLKIGLGK